MRKHVWFAAAVSLSGALAQEPCTFSPPAAALTVPYRAGNPELKLDPNADEWRSAGHTAIAKDCAREVEYADLRTEVRAFWTDTDVYFLFECPYRELNLFLPAAKDKPRWQLWDRDVVELFLGDDWQNIRHYREFEIAPTGDWIDLAIDLDKKETDRAWRSGWTTAARIDETARVWYAAAKIPLTSVSSTPVSPGTRWRMNLYRIDGKGPDSQRRFLCWQPTCVGSRDPNHVPEHFGVLVFER
jgi:hypothetical protein